MEKKVTTYDKAKLTVVLTEDDAALVWRIVLSESPTPRSLEHAFVACAERIAEVQSKLRNQGLEGEPVQHGPGKAPWKVSLHR